MRYSTVLYSTIENKRKLQPELLVLTLFYMTELVYLGINLNLSIDLIWVNRKREDCSFECICA